MNISDCLEFSVSGGQSDVQDRSVWLCRSRVEEVEASGGGTLEGSSWISSRPPSQAEGP